MLKDLQFAFRQYAKSPGFTAVVVLSLALGIAANTTVLCWLQRFVLHPLSGVEKQDEIAVLVSNQGGGNVSLPDLRDFAAESKVFAGAFASMSTSVCLTVDRAPEWHEAQVVTATFFDVLGVRPVLGRTFRSDEDQSPGGNPVLVISERLWRQRFNASPDVIGRVVDLKRRSFTIVGVVPKSFEGSLPPSRFDIWAPASMIWEVRNQGTYFLTQRNARGWHNLFRLAPGVSLEQAKAAVATISARLTQTYPKENRDARYRLVSLSQCPWGGQTVLGPALRLLLAISLGVQLIVTANVANLLLARAVDRRREIAIRLSAGASRGRLIRLFMTESVLLSLAGGLVGILIASWTVDSIIYLVPAELRSIATAQNSLTFSLDALTLSLTFALTVLTGVLFGLAPALQATRGDMLTALKDGARGSSRSGAHHRLRRILVVSEVALALVLLVSAALCAKGLRRAQRIDTGFNPQNVLIGRLQIGMNGYDAESGRRFYHELRQRVATQPGVQEAALASWFPLGLAGCKGTGVQVEGYVPPSNENPTYNFVTISPRFFAVMQIPLLAGRDFTDADDAGSPPVAIINESFARRFWPGLDPIGRRFRSNGKWRTVIGLVKAGKYNRLDEEPLPFMYLPYQQGVPDLDLDLCVRTAAEPTAFATTLRNTIHQCDPGVELLRTVSLANYSSMAFFAQRLASSLLVLLGCVALALSAMGVYAVIAYAVSQRTQEFGVRLALGAEPKHLLLDVLSKGAALALVGIAIGIGLSLAITRLLSGFLYGVSPFDPVAFAIVAALLAAIALIACYVPARRAMRVDPIEALRAE